MHYISSSTCCFRVLTMSAFRASNYSITVSDSRPDGSVCKALLCNRKLQMNPISVRMKLSLRN